MGFHMETYLFFRSVMLLCLSHVAGLNNSAVVVVCVCVMAYRSIYFYLERHIMDGRNSGVD